MRGRERRCIAYQKCIRFASKQHDACLKMQNWVLGVSPGGGLILFWCSPGETGSRPVFCSLQLLAIAGYEDHDYGGVVFIAAIE